MTKETREKLATLRAVAPKLNAAVDDAQAVIREVEKFLVDDLNLGIPAESSEFNEQTWEDDSDDSGPPTSLATTRHLAFGRSKSSGKYAILILERTSREEATSYGTSWREIDRKEVAWGSLPREQKLESFGKLDDLLGRLVSESARLAEQAEKTSRSIRGMMESLKVEGPQK